ncbi:MAG: glycosyltransferase family 2 protein [Alphaproteobacteria bacterium]|nr:glycosyltransferase family 2 protein [Alphaproteobacteria bacterium]
MKKILGYVGQVTGLFCLLLVTAKFFYEATNNYYNVLGKFRDFSVYAWLGMFSIWGTGFYFWLKKKKSFGLMFAAWLSVICFAFDCYRFVIFAGDDICKLYIRIILAIMFLLYVAAIGFHLRQFAYFSVAAFLCIFFGCFFLYPVIFTAKDVFLLSGAGSLLWLFLRKKEKKSLVLLSLLYMFLLYTFCAIGWSFYDRTHGIRFYEKPVTEVAENIKVSVVMPVYNAENTIERALDSLRHQTLKDIEIICVDDGSTDNTSKILAKYAAFDKRIRVIRQENAFIGMARNRGMEEAKGEFIGFVDSDDWVSLDYFEKLYKIAQEKQTKIAETKVIWDVVNEYYPHAKQMAVHAFKENAENKQVLNASSFEGFSKDFLGYVWDKIYKRSFLEENNIKFTFYRTVYEDSYFSFQIYMSGEPIAVAENGSYYYWKGPSYTHRTVDKPTDEAVPFFKAFEKMIRDYGFDKEQENRLLDIYRKYRNLAFQNYYEGINNDKGRKIWREMVLEAFPDAGIDFDKIDEEIAQSEKEVKDNSKKRVLY